MGERYAVYHAPERDSELCRFGSCWLGRCAETGEHPAHPDLPGLGFDDLHGLTSEPRHYGFHATLVPPFRLKAVHGVGDLLEHAIRFVRLRQSFDLPPLSVKEIGSFVAMVPSGQNGVAELAADCVRSFFPFREEPTLAEMERRRGKGLTPAQERLLVRWGYPYVFGEYRFHLTLTNSIMDKSLRRRLVKGLTELTAPLRRAPQSVRELCIFHQTDEAAPFSLVHRIPFGA